MTASALYTFETPALVEYAHSESLANAPGMVATDLRLRVLDTLAAIVAGFRVEGGALGAEYAVETFAGDGATILDGSNRHLGMVGCTYANAMAANALDVDDGNRQAEGHPAAVLVPATLSCAEDQDATVGEFLDALLAGYEISVRAKLAIHHWAGMHTSSGSWGAVGAAASVSRVLGLDHETTADALGIAEFNAPVSPVMRSVARPASSMTKDGIGWGSHLGTSAALLAKRGFSGSGTVFDEIEWQGLEDIPLPPLGEEYLLTQGYFKPYPACRWIHSGIDASLELINDNDIDPASIESVTVQSHKKAIALATPRPETPDEAQYSYPYMLAVTLIERDWLTPEHLNESWRRDEQVHRLIDRIDLQLDEDAQNRYPEESLSRIQIVTENDVYETGLVHPRGSRERPMTADDHATKQELYIDRYLGVGSSDRMRSVLSKPDAPIHDLIEPIRDGN